MSVSPAGNSSAQAPASFEIKSTRLSMVVLILKSAAWEVLLAELEQRFGPQGESPDFFDQEALVIDFSALPGPVSAPELDHLLATVRRCGLVPVAVRGATPDGLAVARAAGLVEAPVEPARARTSAPESGAAAAAVREVIREVVTEVVREVPGPATLVIDKPLRSGQKIYARGADLVVLAMVNPGAEVVADGNIHVYAPLRGKAMAGASGNTRARIFSLCLEPELISIAGVYRTSENPLAPAVRGKPAQVRLSDDGQDKLLFEALNS